MWGFLGALHRQAGLTNQHPCFLPPFLHSETKTCPLRAGEVRLANPSKCHMMEGGLQRLAQGNGFAGLSVRWAERSPDTDSHFLTCNARQMALWSLHVHRGILPRGFSWTCLGFSVCSAEAAGVGSEAVSLHYLELMTMRTIAWNSMTAAPVITGLWQPQLEMAFTPSSQG